MTNWHPEYVSPEEEAAREEQRRVDRVIHELHDSLPARSSDLLLFTFAEIKAWGLKHCRKRARE